MEKLDCRRRSSTCSWLRLVELCSPAKLLLDAFLPRAALEAPAAEKLKEVWEGPAIGDAPLPLARLLR